MDRIDNVDGANYSASLERGERICSSNSSVLVKW